ATVQSKDAVKVITVRSTAFDAADASGGSGAVERMTAPADTGHAKVIAQELTKSERPELTSRPIVISVGVGWPTAKNSRFWKLWRTSSTPRLGRRVRPSTPAMYPTIIRSDKLARSWR